ncbi:polysaccharide biosynthesis/export family protein [Terricaulis silvestris]|uniref:Polysaccharide export protein Wza n=1 Tax=Terricaulis silvestris TaxID=2686094 RepID=A0A6I6MFU3_9CAUL|nr:polysaccharide biosynthesis/export family protein [Terricaulis silvestris]QGZ93380.1 polysaccharide export protein Wza [Terricaulis silvestris]
MGWLKDLRRSLIGLAMVALCAACGSSSGGVDPSTAISLQQPSLAEYRLGPSDRLRISVFGEPDLTGEFVVSAGGMVSYPLIGDHPATGKTVAEFSESLRTALTRYVLQPNISVEVMNYRPFFILGEVRTPGTYPYSAGLTVMSAVATAGGFGYRADTSRVFIKHPDESIERTYRLTSTTPVLPGDTVRIRQRRF